MIATELHLKRLLVGRHLVVAGAVLAGCKPWATFGGPGCDARRLCGLIIQPLRCCLCLSPFTCIAACAAPRAAQVQALYSISALYYILLLVLCRYLCCTVLACYIMQQQQPTQVNSASFFWKGGDSGWLASSS